MNPVDGRDRPTSPADTYATKAPSDSTLDYRNQLAPGSAEEVELARANAVPVVLVVDRAEFERCLTAYGLMDPGAIRAFLEGRPKDQVPSDATSLARLLVHDGRLTRYQASAILQGKGKVLTIGPYLVTDRLGSGGMGMVFQARHRESGRVVALKLLPPSASRQDHVVLRFRREARIMARIAHPNVVSLHDIGEHNGVHYLVMDHVEGRDLQRLVRDEGPLDVRRAVGFVVQAAHGLAEAHHHGVVHRDIKPANLMVDARETVRVLDLGLARITRPEEAPPSGDSDASLTHAGMVMGTVDFLPPEQSNNSRNADARSDIYSLGCTLYYILTARPPYSGETVMERLIAHHQRAVPSLRQARSDVPIGLDVVFRKMLDKDPARRPQSMGDLIVELEACLEWPGPAERPTLARSGRVAADRKPEESDLSGYEILPPSREEIWSPLLRSSKVPEPEPSRVALGPPLGARRQSFGLVLIGMVVFAVIAILKKVFWP